MTLAFLLNRTTNLEWNPEMTFQFHFDIVCVCAVHHISIAWGKRCLLVLGRWPVWLRQRVDADNRCVNVKCNVKWLLITYIQIFRYVKQFLDMILFSVFNHDCD